MEAEMDAQHTPGPWSYVAGNEHHGPYVTSDYGSTIADCYAMSDPTSLSVRNGGVSKPILHLAEMAEPNARLIAAAPDLLDTVQQVVDAWNSLPEGHYSLKVIEAWLHGPMRTALQASRAAIARATTPA